MKVNPAAVTCAEQMEMTSRLKRTNTTSPKMCVLLIQTERKSLESFFICLWILSYEEQLDTFSFKPNSPQKETEQRSETKERPQLASATREPQTLPHQLSPFLSRKVTVISGLLATTVSHALNPATFQRCG